MSLAQMSKMIVIKSGIRYLENYCIVDFINSFQLLLVRSQKLKKILSRYALLSVKKNVQLMIIYRQ